MDGNHHAYQVLPKHHQYLRPYPPDAAMIETRWPRKIYEVSRLQQFRTRASAMLRCRASEMWCRVSGVLAGLVLLLLWCLRGMRDIVAAAALSLPLQVQHEEQFAWICNLLKASKAVAELCRSPS